MTTKLRSSYIENDFGGLFKQYAIAFQPTTFVELGVLDGYSTLHIAKGIEWLAKNRAYRGHLDAYDLFDDYEFKHGRKDDVEKLLEDNGVAQYVNVQKGDAYKVYSNYPDMVLDKVLAIEFLHIDISNTGQVIRSEERRVGKECRL